MTRQQANYKILQILFQEVLNQPDIRFGQLMRNLEVISEGKSADWSAPPWINEFNLEPQQLLKRIEAACRAQNIEIP